ncbi:hypothetical protein N658DRAFT_480573 [Parathielavia hyrcaniae]|uniref:SH3 domain-containing protein n=1 Tax=Parathielavia hyrcaniae TaxID=113614 RepID=A0AAN6PUU8_9PEZI|nr:hypothetical protein N658DRAFT_480573 [Parathielavia hyrcaniae]
MKLVSLLTAGFLTTGLFAAPVTEDGASDIEAREPADVGVSKREVHRCYIVGGSPKVNCRAGPGTSYKVVRAFERGNWYNFGCVQSGECITLNGATNCGWDYTVWGGQECYVNGHYTDSSCTLAKLGKC